MWNLIAGSFTNSVLFRSFVIRYCTMKLATPIENFADTRQRKDSSLVKIVPQLPGCDRLCPVRREVGKPPPALLDGHTLPQQKGRKFVKAASLGKCLPYRPAQLRLVRFKLGGLGRLSCGFSDSVLFIKGKLSFLCRPVFPFGYPFLAAA